ncbi:MAG: flagellar basal body P-ring formation protein FlgA [Deltaproteobacteria bacterium]|nr:flagellar basal body P-ring formation protein FlgA [Deltaproteobacteria bacterium]
MKFHLFHTCTISAVFMMMTIPCQAGSHGRFTSKRLRNAVLEALWRTSPYPKEWVKLEYIKGGPDHEISERTKLDIQFSASSRFLGPVPAKVYESMDGEQERSYWVTAFIRVTIPVVVTTRDMARGSVISPEDVCVAKRDLADLSASYIQADKLSQVYGMKLKVPFAAGRPLYSKVLKQPAVVHKGDPVEILARGNGILITAPGIARADAGVGEMVPVLNKRSRLQCICKVLDERQVEVRF